MHDGYTLIIILGSNRIHHSGGYAQGPGRGGQVFHQQWNDPRIHDHPDGKDVHGDHQMQVPEGVHDRRGEAGPAGSTRLARFLQHIRTDGDPRH